MKRIVFAAAAAALVVPAGIGSAALADPGDDWNKQWEIRAECDKKLREADSAREFRKVAAECNKKLAKWSAEQRKEAVKAWRESEKQWRERQPQWSKWPRVKWDD